MRHTVRMLKTLPGVDDGSIYPATYHAGEEYAIGDELLRCFVELGGVELVREVHPRDPAAGEPPADASVPPAGCRETKVVAPAETKPLKPLERMSKAELVTHAQTALGLELVPDSMTLKQMVAAIRAAQG